VAGVIDGGMVVTLMFVAVALAALAATGHRGRMP